MQRNLKQCSNTLRIQAYLSYARPIIESVYASTVRSPHNMCDIQKLEMIPWQHKAARFVFNDFSRYSV